MMLSALFKALGDLLSPDFRGIVIKALGLTLVLFATVLIGVEALVIISTQFSWPWAEWALAVGTGLVLVVAFFFLMAPVSAIFAGLFLDAVAEQVEMRHYPRDRPGVPLRPVAAIVTALQFAVIVLVVNLAILPMVFFGIGAIVLIVANAYLLGREYFEMIAMRHLSIVEARRLRKENAALVFVAGLAPAFLTLIPAINLIVPFFATAYYVHIFKRVLASSV
ncbi:MAG: EI24 domain-containing protein [Alphaproteobacteria bacterium]|nr:EI24 domain-containing protein [Alphaproteobacteria bacterium]